MVCAVVAAAPGGVPATAATAPAVVPGATAPPAATEPAATDPAATVPGAAATAPVAAEMQVVAVRGGTAGASVVVALPPAQPGVEPQLSATDADGADVPVTSRPLLASGPLGVVIGAADPDAPATLSAARATATDVMLGVGPQTDITVVASGSEPRILARPDDGTSAAVGSLVRLLPGGSATTPGVRRAAAELADGAGAEPGTLVVFAAAGEKAPVDDTVLAEEIIDSGAVPYVLAPEESAAYWRLVLGRTGGLLLTGAPGSETTAASTTPPVAGLAETLASQHLVEVPAGTEAGRITLEAATPAGTLSAEVDLPAAAADPAAGGNAQDAAAADPASDGVPTTLLVLLGLGSAVAALVVAALYVSRRRASRRRLGPGGGHARTRRGAPSPVTAARDSRGRATGGPAGDPVHARRTLTRPGTHRRIGSR